MKRAIFAILSTIGSLTALLSFQTHTTPTVAIASSDIPDAPNEDAPTSTTVAPTTTSTTAVRSGPDKVPATTTTTSTTTTTIAVHTVTGPAVSTKYGPIQVQVSLKGSKITSVKTIQYPQASATSTKLNQDTLNKLQTEVLSAQSANIDSISGATDTFDGFVGSLKGALGG